MTEIGGKNCTLRYTVNAICALEDLVGGSLNALSDRPYTAARLLLWAGLLAAQPQLTLTDVGERIDKFLASDGTLEEVLEVCAAALRRDGFIE